MKTVKATAPHTSRQTDFRANDLLKLASLSYRQLNDWEGRADISGSRRTGSAGWRRFTANEVFVLMVCSEIRQQFGVPLDSLCRIFNSKAHTRFKFASSHVLAGDEVWLATDLQKVFAVSLNCYFNGMLERSKNAVILLRLTPLLKRLLNHQKAAESKTLHPSKLKP